VMIEEGFPEDAEDVTWLPVVASRGWVILTKDKRIRRGGRDLKVRPPAGQDGTAPDRTGQDAGNRGLTASADGRERPSTTLERQSVSALVAGALEALDRGEVAAALALLRDVEARLAGGRVTAH